MANVAGDPKACEVTITIDLRRGFSASIASIGAGAGCPGAGLARRGGTYPAVAPMA